ncbi:ABC transporter substrate-binding protein [Rhodobacter capsulatus]|uniref:ABC transporter substrate-binding protein n=1 Tax=Rhodobacter capsulatus TaxID=1061 RepID=UPI0003D35BA4|nr:ABC transporter substrate-binding protein [Rhodobacter capsulatus]ETD87911.1 hypothetical protein U713_16145 [Rhodobacter capsulatus YW2]
MRLARLCLFSALSLSFPVLPCAAHTPPPAADPLRPGFTAPLPADVAALDPSILLGDRLVAVARHLGVESRAFSLRQNDAATEMAKLPSGALALSSPRVMADVNSCEILVAVLETQPERILVEQTGATAAAEILQDPMRLMPLMTAEGGLIAVNHVKIEIADYTLGDELFIYQIGQMLNRGARAETLLQAREATLAHVETLLPLPARPRTLVLSAGPDGILRQELRASPISRDLLDRLGLENAARPSANGGTEDGAARAAIDGAELAALAPEMIVLTGEPVAARRALDAALSAVPAAAAVPAVATGRIAELPGWNGYDIIAYPALLERWASALRRMAPVPPHLP